MSVIHVEHTNDYTVLTNRMLEDKRLSFKARGLLAYLLTKSETWEAQTKQLSHASERDGLSAIYSALEELAKFGYATYEQPRSSGRFSKGGWTIRETPHSDFLHTEKPHTEKPRAENRRLSNYSEEVNTEEIDTPLSTGAVDNHPAPTEIATLELTAQAPVIPPKVPRAPKTQQAHLAANAVLAHLNHLTGRTYRVLGLIPHVLTAGATEADCLLVLDWLHTERRKQEPEWVRDYMDPTTPFRPANFDKYLARAQEWHSRKQHPPQKTQSTGWAADGSFKLVL